MVRNEVVRRRKWLDDQRFFDLLGVTNLIPGPNSTEMVIHIGHPQAGWSGLIIAGACFIFPAMFLVLALAWAYVRFASIPQAGWLLYGVKPVVIAVIVQALWSLGRKAVKTPILLGVGLAIVVLHFLRVDAILLLLAGGIFIFVALSNPLIPRIRNPSWAGGFLDGINVASLGLMGAVSWQLGQASIADAPTVLLAIISLVLLLRFKSNPTRLILGGMVFGVSRGVLH